MTSSATITDIQRFCLHDGPGIRTTVFVKGCNLRCRWCHNPETLRPEPQLQFLPDRCIGCGACLEACPNQAHAVSDGRRVFDRSRCDACGACASQCYAGALVIVGRSLTVENVLQEVLDDREFHLSSAGGVTVSGGEPLCEREFTCELLGACKDAGLHTAVETNLAWPWDEVASILPVTDLIMMDVKMTDPALHERWTGGGNELILDNARRLSGEDVPLVVRTPVIVGANATTDQIGRIAGFVGGFPNLLYYELLPYHPLGAGKYESLGMECFADGLACPDRSAMRALAAAARQQGVEVRCRDE